jgi:ketosteroid isomerase-like protein
MVELQGDRVAVEVHEDVRGEASGIAVKRLAGAVFAIRAGLVSRIEWFGTAREAFAAVGVAGVGLSPENEDAAIGFLAAFQNDDVAAMLAVTDPDIEIRGRLSLEQVYRGHEGVRRWHQDRRDAWERFDIVLERLVAADEDTCVGVYALGARGRESGIELRERIAVLGSLRDGLIMAGQVFLDPSEAFAAAGMEAP